MTTVAQRTVSRNDPCPCGSGKRFKDCHGSLRGDAPARTTAPAIAPKTRYRPAGDDWTGLSPEACDRLGAMMELALKHQVEQRMRDSERLDPCSARGSAAYARRVAHAGCREAGTRRFFRCRAVVAQCDGVASFVPGHRTELVARPAFDCRTRPSRSRDRLRARVAAASRIAADGPVGHEARPRRRSPARCTSSDRWPIPPATTLHG